MNNKISWENLNGKSDDNSVYSINNMNNAKDRYSIINMNGTSDNADSFFSFSDMNGMSK